MTDLELLSLLGLGAGDFNAVKTAPSVAEAEVRLVALKERAKKGYRAQARNLHPDLHGEDPEKVKILVALNDLMAKLDKLVVQVVPRPQPVQWVRFTGPGYGAGSTTTTTTTAGWGKAHIYVNGMRVS